MPPSGLLDKTLLDDLKERPFAPYRLPPARKPRPGDDRAALYSGGLIPALKRMGGAARRGLETMASGSEPGLDPMMQVGRKLYGAGEVLMAPLAAWPTQEGFQTVTGDSKLGQSAAYALANLPMAADPSVGKVPGLLASAAKSAPRVAEGVAGASGLLAREGGKGYLNALEAPGAALESGLNKIGYTAKPAPGQLNMFVPLTRTSKPPPIVGADGKKRPALTVAKEMREAGADPADIWKVTGLEYHPIAKQWRWEIDDSKAKASIDLDAAHAKWTEQFRTEGLSQPINLGTLDKVYDHPELYKNVPHLRDVDVVLDPHAKGASYAPRRYARDFDVRNAPPKFWDKVSREPALVPDQGLLGAADNPRQLRGTITLGTRERMSDPDKRLTITERSLPHEIQHAIRTGSKGFPEGGNPSVDGHDNYWRNAGEVEARLTPVRTKLSAEQRRDYYPGRDPDPWMLGQPQVSYQHDFPYFPTANIPNHSQIMGRNISPGLYGEKYYWNTAKGLQEADGGGFAAPAPRGINPNTGKKNTRGAQVEIRTSVPDLRKVARDEATGNINETPTLTRGELDALFKQFSAWVDEYKVLSDNAASANDVVMQKHFKALLSEARSAKSSVESAIKKGMFLEGSTGLAKGVQEADGGFAAPAPRGPLSVSAARRAGITPTTKNTQRIAFPGIYKHPNELTDAAAALVAPESPALKGLFGVTRDDLYQIGRGRKGNVDATAIFPAGARGSEAASNVTTGRNAQRLVDAMSVAEQRAPQLTNPMDAWYVMDPAFQRLEQLVGREEAVRRFNDLNAFTSMASPASDVITEMNRGTTANYLNRLGRFGDFEAHSTTPVGKRGDDFPADISGLKPHPYGGTAHSQPMRKYVDGGLLDSGFLNVQTSKVPTYHMASGVPETGFQTNVPVGDAHFARAIGLPDVRNMLTLKGRPVIPQANATMPEIATLTPWWQQQVVGPLGIESVPGQARAWGLFSPQSGVDTPIGAPKLELLAAEIERLALQAGVDPAQLRDAILLGDAGLGNNPAMLPGLLSTR